MVYYPKPAANEKYAQFYLKYAKQCAKTGDYENTCIFLDLAEDFMPEVKDYSDILLKNRIHRPIKSEAWLNSIYFSLDRAEDLMLNREKDKSMGVGVVPTPTEFDKHDTMDWTPIRVQAAKNLLDYARENGPRTFPSDIINRFKNIETLIEQYH